jgi:hypothetical protein
MVGHWWVQMGCWLVAGGLNVICGWLRGLCPRMHLLYTTWLQDAMWLVARAAGQCASGAGVLQVMVVAALRPPCTNMLQPASDW